MVTFTDQRDCRSYRTADDRQQDSLQYQAEERRRLSFPGQGLSVERNGPDQCTNNDPESIPLQEVESAGSTTRDLCCWLLPDIDWSVQGDGVESRLILERKNRGKDVGCRGESDGRDMRHDCDAGRKCVDPVQCSEDVPIPLGCRHKGSPIGARSHGQEEVHNGCPERVKNSREYPKLCRLPELTRCSHGEVEGQENGDTQPNSNGPGQNSQFCRVDQKGGFSHGSVCGTGCLGRRGREKVNEAVERKDNGGA